MNINIGKLDLIKLSEEIKKFEDKNAVVPYIFMSEETHNDLCHAITSPHRYSVGTTDDYKERVINLVRDGKIPYMTYRWGLKDPPYLEYKGNIIHFDNTLDFGEIELR